MPTEDDEDDIDKYVRWYNMTKAATFDPSIIPVNIRENFKNRCRYYLSSADLSEEEEATSPSNLKASSPSNQNDSKWDIGKTLLQHKIVTKTAEQGICLAKTPTYSLLNARIAFTIMGQATRLCVLQNKQESQMLSNWNMMAMKLFNSIH